MRSCISWLAVDEVRKHHLITFAQDSVTKIGNDVLSEFRDIVQLVKDDFGSEIHGATCDSAGAYRKFRRIAFRRIAIP